MASPLSRQPVQHPATAAPGAPARSPFAPLAVLIPAWQPTSVLISLVQDLRLRGFSTLIVVDDGSTEDALPIFRQLATQPGVQILRHARNRGKGQALKTGLAYLLHTRPELTGVLTADADGQHLPADIEQVARALLRDPSRPVLGTRSLRAGVPLRSRLGNAFTRGAFGLLTGTRLADTQTGLRGLPRTLIPALLTIPGERYEYETAVLAYLCRNGNAPQEVPIATVYLDGNRGSHFHPVLDSLRVYGTLLHAARPRRSSR